MQNAVAVCGNGASSPIRGQSELTLHRPPRESRAAVYSVGSSEALVQVK